MPSLISKITLQVTRRFVPAKRLMQTSEIDVAKMRGEDAKIPKRWMTAGSGLSKGTLGGLTSWAVLPKRIKHPERVVLYLHGGAYVAGPLFWQWSMCGSIARQSGVRIEVLDYPLAPESTFEESIAKTLAAYQELTEQYSPSNISVLSDSAGGGLSAALMFELARLNIERPRRLLMISPWIDVELLDPEVAEIEARDPMLAAAGLRACGLLYAGSPGKMSDPSVSPILGDLSVLPEIHIYNGLEDLLSWSIRKFAQKAGEQGVEVKYSEWPGQMHAWVVVPVVPEAIRVRKRIAAIIAR